MQFGYQGKFPRLGYHKNLTPPLLAEETCTMSLLHTSHIRPKDWRDTRQHLCRSASLNAVQPFQVTIYFWVQLTTSCGQTVHDGNLRPPSLLPPLRRSNYAFLWTWLQQQWIFGLCMSGQCTSRRYETMSVPASCGETRLVKKKKALSLHWKM